MNEYQQSHNKECSEDESPTRDRIDCAKSQSPREEAHSNSQNLVFGMTRDRFVELCFALAITIFTGGMWWTSSDQVAVMKEQTKAMRDQLTEIQNAGVETEKLIAATEKIADATKNSVTQSKVALDVTSEASRLDQRAWVGVVAAKNPHVKPGTPVGLEVRYINTGKTPARKFKVDIAVKYQLTNQNFVPTFTKPDTNPSTVIILPQMEVWSDASKTNIILTQEEINGVMAGTAMLYVFGRFTYRTLNSDGGGTFCFYIQRNLIGAPSWCDSYNDVY